MCLYTHQLEPCIAPCDIPIIKICITNYFDKKSRFYSPYRGTLVGLPPKKSTTPMVLLYDIQPENKEPRYLIRGGVIHAFQTQYRDVAIQYSTERNHTLFKSHLIGGYIPKGTQYWVGENGDICAKKIKYYFIEQMNVLQKLRYFVDIYNILQKVIHYIGLPYRKLLIFYLTHKITRSLIRKA